MKDYQNAICQVRFKLREGKVIEAYDILGAILEDINKDKNKEVKDGS